MRKAIEDVDEMCRTQVAYGEKRSRGTIADKAAVGRECVQVYVQAQVRAKALDDNQDPRVQLSTRA